MEDGTTIGLPPGFRFDPTDEELVVHFLFRKVARLPCYPIFIPELELHTCDPWELNGKALWSGNEWYFYSRAEENRVTENGYWKQLGMDEPVVTGAGNNKVGIKKLLVFYRGHEGPGGIKTDWVMQEYHLHSRCFDTKSYKSGGNQKSDLNKLVLRRVHERNGICEWRKDYHESNQNDDEEDDDGGVELSFLDEVFMSMDDEYEEISFPN